MRKHSLVVGICIDSPDEFVEGVEIQSEVEIMYECLFFVTDVNESSVERRKNLLHFSQIDVAH